MFGGHGGHGGHGGFGGGFTEAASDYMINQFVPGGLNSPMGMMADNLIGGNPNGGMNFGGMGGHGGMGMGGHGGMGMNPYGGMGGGYGNSYGYGYY